MPDLFLSPSTQKANLYVTSGSEQYWMNRLADEMEPWLRASGINVTRNDPDGSAVTSIRQSNRGEHDFHLALHSNAAPDALAGQIRGVIAFYFPTSILGLRMAEIIIDNLKEIYPLPELARTEPSISIGEIRQTRAPAVLLEVAFHDNLEDAQWIENNLPEIAEKLALSVTEYFGVPFLAPGPERPGTVVLSSGSLNLRNLPIVTSRILRQIPNGATVTVINQTDGWYIVEYDGTIGFVRQEFVRV
jgi:uncharacterized protein YgiM (DUF1202 family)